MNHKNDYICVVKEINKLNKKKCFKDQEGFFILTD